MTDQAENGIRRAKHGVAALWARRETRWLLLILAVGLVLRLGMAVYLGNDVTPTPAAYDQIFFHDVALNLLAGKGFVYTRPPWPFIQSGVPTAFGSFLYPLFLAAVYGVLGPHALAARIVQAVICALLPLQVYGLVRRIAGRQESVIGDRGSASLRAARRVAGIRNTAAADGERLRFTHHASRLTSPALPLIAAAITAGYAYFVYYSATLMTEGLYLVMVVWALAATLDLAQKPTAGRWASWALAGGLAILLRQVFMPIVALLLLYVLWQRHWRVRLRHVALAGAIGAALILPWTVRNYLVFDRFLLLNAQAGQTFWNANHPDLGVTWNPSGMFPIPADLEGVNEVDLGRELMRRGWQNVLADPLRVARLSLDRLRTWLIFYPMRESSGFSNVARTASFGICLPFMVAGLVLSLREWRRWLLLYGFIVVYTLIHVISWVQIRYRMPVDVALVPFAALAVVGLGDLFVRRSISVGGDPVNG